ncbi:hypothetical protein ACRAWG_00540 [Methylobacterium sp. P31]
MRVLQLFTAGFLLAAAMFVTTMLTSPPTSEAAISESGATPPLTICEFLPTGDIASCTIQN